MIYVLDAHAVLWYLEDEQNLGERALHIFGDSRARLVVPTISLAEVLWALRKRADLTVWDALLATIREDTCFVIYPLDLEVVAKTPKSLEMHDAMICATALLLADSTGDDVEVITRDKQIIDSGLVSTVW